MSRATTAKLDDKATALTPAPIECLEHINQSMSVTDLILENGLWTTYHQPALFAAHLCYFTIKQEEYVTLHSRAVLNHISQYLPDDEIDTALMRYSGALKSSDRQDALKFVSVMPEAVQEIMKQILKIKAVRAFILVYLSFATTADFNQLSRFNPPSAAQCSNPITKVELLRVESFIQKRFGLPGSITQLIQTCGFRAATSAKKKNKDAAPFSPGLKVKYDKSDPFVSNKV